ncbi:MAG TPA: hypothetical protein ENH41_02425 [Candidatus Omnitrophica bacterium]|nr:hypothetical protein [Candidatus Omnitrophota bacterium]
MDYKRRSIGRNKEGVTIIELLVVVVLIVGVISVIGLVLKGGLRAWFIGEGEFALQRQVQRIIMEIVEGSDNIAGIRETLEIIEVTPTSLGVVPLWIDIHRKYEEESKEFVLSKQFKAGAALPIGQIKPPDSKKFFSVPILFKYGEERNPDSPDDVVIFANDIPKGADVRIFFHPDATLDEQVIMRYYWDKESQKVFRTYRGWTEDVMRYGKGVNVIDFKFTYFDNLNNQIEPVYSNKTGAAVVPERVSALSAIGIGCRVERGTLVRELSSFVSVRSLGGNLGSGLALTEGAIIRIPNSQNIRTLVLDNIAGVKQDDVLEIEVESSRSSRIWKVSIKFGIVDGGPSIIGFDIDYPLGFTVYSSRRRRIIKKGLNLLKLGNEYFDYDDDKNVNDIVSIEGDEVTLRVAKMDIAAAAVYVRP